VIWGTPAKLVAAAQFPAANWKARVVARTWRLLDY
jgi:hypothetical protein